MLFALMVSPVAGTTETNSVSCAGHWATSARQRSGVRVTPVRRAVISASRRSRRSSPVTIAWPRRSLFRRSGGVVSSRADVSLLCEAVCVRAMPGCGVERRGRTSGSSPSPGWWRRPRRSGMSFYADYPASDRRRPLCHPRVASRGGEALALGGGVAVVSPAPRGPNNTHHGFPPNMATVLRALLATATKDRDRG
jgi:hypothetical protein